MASTPRKLFPDESCAERILLTASIPSSPLFSANAIGVSSSASAYARMACLRNIAEDEVGCGSGQGSRFDLFPIQCLDMYAANAGEAGYHVFHILDI